MTDNVLNKLESLRIATLIMTQSATANKGESIPSLSEVLDEAKKIHKWLVDG